MNKKNNHTLRDLGDGLVMRKGSAKDVDQLSSFNGRMHSDEGPEQPHEGVEVWTKDLLSKPHPSFKPGDFTIIEDKHSGEIVSSMNFIFQTWSYAGIPFGVGRIEMVGTHPEYRNRGLIREQFQVIHQWSIRRAEKMQVIAGIPYYYRQFGYEMALNLGGGRYGYKPDIPTLKDKKEEPHIIRAATEEDLNFILKLELTASKRSLVNCIRDRDLWLYELCGKSDNNVTRMQICIVEDLNKAHIGYLAHPVNLWGSRMVAVGYEVAPGHSWAAVTPTVLRYLYATGESCTKKNQKLDEFGMIGFWLGEEHPVYKVTGEILPRRKKPYAWYVRLPDLIDFLKLITPVLEQRLSESSFSGQTGEYKISFYRKGIRLVFEKGSLSEVTAWKPVPQGHSGDAAFPELTFLQFLFGYRDLTELNHAFPDCWWENDETFGILSAIFPKQHSNIWAFS